MRRTNFQIDVDTLCNAIAITLIVGAIVIASLILNLKFIWVGNVISFSTFIALICIGNIVKYVGTYLSYKFNYKNVEINKKNHDEKIQNLSKIDFINTIIFTPLIEELIFRNGILQWLLKYSNGFFAIVIASALHTFFHTKDRPLFIIHFGMGCVFAGIYLYFGLIGAIIYHSFHNFVVIKKIRKN